MAKLEPITINVNSVNSEAIENFVKKIFTKTDFSSVRPEVIELFKLTPEQVYNLHEERVIPKQEHLNYPNLVRKRYLRPIK